MSINRERDSIYVISEDQRLRSVAIGFFTGTFDMSQNIQVAPFSKGWPDVKDRIPWCNNYLRQYPKSRVVLVIDFDNDPDRCARFMQDVAEDVKDRLFILGPLHNVEELKRCCGASSFEGLGSLLRDDCSRKNSPDSAWNCTELAPFSRELQRICENVKDFLWTR